MFRLAKTQDLEKITTLCEQIKQKMHNTDQIQQWNNGYPNKNVFLEDINQQQIYVIEKETEIIGFIVLNTDQYPSYKQVNWNSNQPCLVIHRFGVSPNHLNQKIGTTLLTNVINIAKQQKINYLKIDTSSQNIPMNSIIKKHNFTYCGQMYFLDNPIAWNCYDLLINNS